MQAITNDNYEAKLKENQGPVILDLWSPQCAPCVALMPDVEAMAKEHEGKIDFFKVDVAENRSVAKALRVMGVPTIIFYNNGEQVGRLSGAEATIDKIKEQAKALFA